MSAIPQAAQRRSFIGGSDARIIMGADEAALLWLWRQKRGQTEQEDLSANLLVQLGLATENLNRRWYETNSGHQVIDIQRHIRHPALHWMGATLDGRVEATGAVFEAKFMLPWSFSEEGAVEKYAPQLQHNMWVIAAREAVLSIITGGGKWVEIKTHADPLYQHLIVTAERKFWRCVESGEPPVLFGVDQPKPRVEAVRIVTGRSGQSHNGLGPRLGRVDRFRLASMPGRRHGLSAPHGGCTDLRTAVRAVCARRDCRRRRPRRS
jgi:predicted phage-related endonuclease